MDLAAFDAHLSTCKHQLLIACDTEFEGPHTLTIQFAARIGDRIVIQVYHSPEVLPPSPTSVATHAQSQLPNGSVRLEVLPFRRIERSLSPAQVVADLFELAGATSLMYGRATIAWGIQSKKPIELTLAAHFWTADFFRCFGSQFFTDVLVPQDPLGRRVFVESTSVLRYREVGPGIQKFRSPVLDQLQLPGRTIPVSIRTFDTFKAFDKASLDRHSQTFIGVSKSCDVSDAEKAEMSRPFRDRPTETFAYAVFDAVITLGVAEQMMEVGRACYGALGLNETRGPIRPTLGSRVADMMTQTIAQQCAVGSAVLSVKGQRLRDGRVGRLSLAKVQEVMRRGTGAAISRRSSTHFGSQTGDTHGGLTFSRSPTKFFHDGPGMFRDVDLGGCYNAILRSMKMYLGRPMISEPGTPRMSLRDAVAMVQEQAAGPHAWIIKVSGKITQSPNVLIPSTEDGLTHANFRSRRAKHQAASRRVGLAFDASQSRREKGYARLYTTVVEAGVVAWSTWLMIQAMPENERKEYEQLEVETILIYPSGLVASTGADYDRLVAERGVCGPNWCQRVHWGSYSQVTWERPDQESISLEFNIGALADRFGQLRHNARRQGLGGAEAAWKLHANAMYGACASPYFETNNVVAANVVTATARALAFAMQMSLNGVQVITDGCTYRRDQIPSGTFASLLATSPQYPIRRVETSTPFLDPAEIPENDEAFTNWYRNHVSRFFGVDRDEYRALFSLHRLEHKRSGPEQSAAFDGLLCDGAANYSKLIRSGAGWHVIDTKARSFDDRAKAVLTPWLLRTYTSDDYRERPPVFEMNELLHFKKAAQKVQKALRLSRTRHSGGTGTAAHLPQLWFPLGFDVKRIATYKILKASNFLFRNPSQYKKFVKTLEKFTAQHACGLEILALRRNTPQRRQGSIVDIAELMYEYIQGDGDNFSKKFNLGRPLGEDHIVEVPVLGDEVRQQRRALLREFLARIQQSQMSESEQLTGLFLQETDLRRIDP